MRLWGERLDKARNSVQRLDTAAQKLIRRVERWVDSPDLEGANAIAALRLLSEIRKLESEYRDRYGDDLDEDEATATAARSFDAKIEQAVRVGRYLQRREARTPRPGAAYNDDAAMGPTIDVEPDAPTDESD